MVVAILAALSFFSVQAPSTWVDSSPHHVRFVPVDTHVRLEVLDWGGRGQALLFVGCYLSGHVYDNIAPKLTDQFHVYAVTRRGVGASDHPPTGYDPQRRSDDVFAVMQALRIRKTLLVGSSCGGDILNTLGAQHSDRLVGLVYLDAAADPTLIASDYAAPPFDPAGLPPRALTPPAVVFPEAEMRMMTEHPIDPGIRKAIVDDNRVRPDYASIRVPVLAIFRTTTLKEALSEFPPRNEGERSAVNNALAYGKAMLSKWEGDLRKGVPAARIVELADANLYMFLSNEADVIREIRTFAASLH